MEQLSKIVSKNLSNLRKNKGLTQQDLASKLNYSDKTVSKWELGYAIPDVETLKQIADFYGVTVDYLISKHNDENKRSKEQIERHRNRFLTMLLIDIFLMAIAIVVFVCLISARNPINFWPVIIIGFSACMFFNAVISEYWWKVSIWPYIFGSLCIWTAILSIYFSVLVMDAYYNFWYLFFIGLPIQGALIVILNLKHRSFKYKS